LIIIISDNRCHNFPRFKQWEDFSNQYCWSQN